MMSKTRAFALHLSLSLLVFSTLILVMYFYWFPGEYFMLDGGWQGIRLIALVDVVLGPALTLLLYKPGKPKLILDMSLIATIQISALAYGFYAAYQQRTVGLVFAEDTFTTLSYQDLLAANDVVEAMGHQPKSFDTLGDSHPKQIVSETLNDANFGQYMADVMNGMPTLRERTDKYRPLAGSIDALSRHQLEHTDIKDPKMLEAIKTITAKTDSAKTRYELYRFKARYGSGVAILDKEAGKITHLVTGSEKRS